MVTAMMMMMAMSTGTARAEAPPPVVGGRPAAEGTWPDVALIWFDDEPGCTGTLVEPDLVLSAGHCARGATHISVGHTRIDDAERVEIFRVHKHPRWGRTLDIAAFRLADPIEGVAPRRISATGLRDDIRVYAVGWGATDPRARQFPDVLMEGALQVWDHDCSDDGWGCNTEVDVGSELVAGADSTDSCNGDSGGPLYQGRGEDAVLVGVTSRAVDGNGPPCGDGGIYVRGDAAQRWISQLPPASAVILERPDGEAEDDAVEREAHAEAWRGGCSTAPASAPLGALPVLLGLSLLRRRPRAE